MQVQLQLEGFKVPPLLHAAQLEQVLQPVEAETVPLPKQYVAAAVLKI